MISSVSGSYRVPPLHAYVFHILQSVHDMNVNSAFWVIIVPQCFPHISVNSSPNGMWSIPFRRCWNQLWYHRILWFLDEFQVAYTHCYCRNCVFVAHLAPNEICGIQHLPCEAKYDFKYTSIHCVLLIYIYLCIRSFRILHALHCGLSHSMWVGICQIAAFPFLADTTSYHSPYQTSWSTHLIRVNCWWSCLYAPLTC